MNKELDIQICDTLKAYIASGVEDQVDYQKFYLYVMNMIQRQLGLVPSIVRREDKGEYIQSLVDSHEDGDSTITQDIMLRHHIANLNQRVLEYQESVN